ncbi:MAG: putative bifunctional diguanylate cyclase/phosphodiesterase [Acidimicrobiales bacterium]
MAAVVAALRAGSVTRAIALDRSGADPSLVTLRRAIEASDAALARSGKTGEHDAIAGLVVTMAVVLASVIALLWFLGRARRREGQGQLEREALARSEERFRALVQDSGDLITLVSADGTIVYVSPSVTALYGHDRAELLGRSLVELVHPDDAETVRSTLAEAGGLSPGDRRRFECRLSCADGSWRSTETIAANRIASPAVQGLLLTTRDVTERVKFQAELSYQAFHDSLTGLANRALLSDRLAHALDRSARTGAKTALVMIDLDEFKAVNDTLGHGAGDELLAAQGARLSASVRPADTVARLGGDEFALLLEDTGASEAEDVVERALASLATPVTTAAGELRVTATAGLAIADGEAAGELLRRADVALYSAKAGGKGRCEVYDPSMHTGSRSDLALTAELSKAIDAGELVVHYQPTVELATGRLVGFEALVRWQHPTRGLLQPGAFIDLAERTGLIVPLGRWVLETACSRAAGWLGADHGGRPLHLQVNVSARQLADAGFVPTVSGALAASGIEPSRLVLEITESEFVTDIGPAVPRLAEIRALGVKVSIDDFGTGWSSLSYLSRLPVDQVKIDKSFVDNIAGAKDAVAVVRAIVDLGHSLGLEIVAEGIEQEAQAARLAELGCEGGQGYLFSRPVDADAIDALIGRSGPGQMPGQVAGSQVAGDDGVYLCSPSWTASETSAIGS